MRMTSRKKDVLALFEPDNSEWVTSEAGAPPLDVSGIAWLLHCIDATNKHHVVESVRRTLEVMVRDGLLDKVTSYERRQNTTQSGSGDGVWCNCSRYGLPGQCAVVHDAGGRRDAIEGECARVKGDY